MNWWETRREKRTGFGGKLGENWRKLEEIKARSTVMKDMGGNFQ